MTDRLQREREFHNLAFADERRETVRKYYSVTCRSDAYYWERVLARARGRRVLEYGCGVGSHACELAREGAEVAAIDLSDVAVARARGRALREGLATRFLVMNAEQLGFADDSFDIICGTAILHHLDLDVALPEIARTLRSDGTAVFAEPMGHNPAINLYRRFTPRIRTPDEHPLLMSDIRRARRYFGGVQARFFHALALAAAPLRRWRRFSRVLGVLSDLDQWLFRHVPGARRMAWLVVLEFSDPLKPRLT